MNPNFFMIFLCNQYYKQKDTVTEIFNLEQNLLDTRLQIAKTAKMT